MKTPVTVEVSLYKDGYRTHARVYVCRHGSVVSRIYHFGYDDEKCISLASVRRALRLQSQLLEVTA